VPVPVPDVALVSVAVGVLGLSLPHPGKIMIEANETTNNSCNIFFRFIENLRLARIIKQYFLYNIYFPFYK
jgi:hypothetical protein